jgi:hypothetical protein
LNLLSTILGGQGPVAERIISEALTWPGVYREKGQFGSIVLRVAQRELGHLRGDAVVEVPLSPELQAQLVKDGVALGLASSRGS